MFTGLVEEVGTIVRVQTENHGRQITIEAQIVTEDMQPGDSIAVQGVCQTVVACTQEAFTVVAVEETLRKTTLGILSTGDKVNLERALLPTRRLGGHFVQGHVETVGMVSSLESRDSSWQLWVEVPPEFMRYIVPLGSIALDGISLTIARVQGTAFMVAIIPHTWENTTLCYRSPGDKVNLEFDIIAKYLESLLSHRMEHQS